jgi:hypothetical protein
MWEFEVRHIPGKKNVVADALSRRPEPEGWSPPAEPEDDVEDFIDHHLGAVTLLFDELPHYLWDVAYACSTTVLGEESVLDHLKTERFRNIAKWLLTLKNPGNMDRKALRRLRNEARRYCIKRGFLWEKTTGDRPLRRVIDDLEEQQHIIKALHDECGHKGKENTWRQVWNRYSWPKMYESVQHYVKTCYQCQIHSSKRWEEELYPTWGPEVPWGWITIDVVYMPNGRNGKKYLVVARDLLTGYVEAKALSTNDSATVVKFLEEYVLSRWGVPYLMSVDGGPENRGLVKDLAVQFGIHRVVSSAYNSKAQGFIERGHQPIVGALKKLTGNWVDNLHLALWADRITVKRSTGESPVYLISGKEHVLPIELSIPTWQTLEWDTVRTSEELVAMRAESLRKRDVRLQESIARTVRLRQEGKEWWDNSKSIRSTPLEPGDLVLVRDTWTDINMSRSMKLQPKWRGPYRVTKVWGNGSYRITDLDGTELRSSYPGNRLTKFHRRSPEDPLTQLDDEAPKFLEEPEEVDDTDVHARVEPLEDTKEASAEGEGLHPSFRRRSARILKHYGQDLPPRQRVEVRIPAEPLGFNRSEYRAMSSGLAKGRPKI